MNIYNFTNKTDCPAYSLRIIVENAPTLEDVLRLKRIYEEYNRCYSGNTLQGLLSAVAEENKCVYRVEKHSVIFSYVGM